MTTGCDTQSFSFRQNLILPSYNFIHDHYNRASKDLLAPYNITTFWDVARDSNWWEDLYQDTNGEPDSIYKQPVNHQYYT